MVYDQLFYRFNGVDKRVRGDYEKYNARLRNVPMLFKFSFYSDLKEVNKAFRKYKWFAKFAGNFKVRFFKDDIENGYPHTIGKTIVLPLSYFNRSKKERMQLLLHEAIHVYQRLHCFEFNRFLFEELDLKIFGFRYDVSNMIRTNPDTNDLLYFDRKIAYMLYKKDARSLSDVNLKVEKVNMELSKTRYEEIIDDFKDLTAIQTEHPYEALACIISYCIANNRTHRHLEDVLAVVAH